MVVTVQNSLQIDNLAASPPVIENTHNLHGVLRIAFFSHTQVGAGDTVSTVKIVKLPPGKIRVLGSLSRIEHNWSISTVDMDVGWKAYVDLDGDAVAADDDDGHCRLHPSHAFAGRLYAEAKTIVAVEFLGVDWADQSSQGDVVRRRLDVDHLHRLARRFPRLAEFEATLVAGGLHSRYGNRRGVAHCRYD